MQLQRVRLYEALAAQVTRMRSIVGVNLGVYEQRAFPIERLLAHVAGEGFQAGVDDRVSF